MKEKTELKVLPIENLVSFVSISPWDVFNIYKKNGFDLIISYLFNPEEKIFEVGIIVFNTSNVEKRHDGDWRYIFGLQGKIYKKDNESFTYYFIPNCTKDMVLGRLEKYFILEIKKQVG